MTARGKKEQTILYNLYTVCGKPRTKVYLFVGGGPREDLHKHWPFPLPNFMHCEHDQQALSDTHNLSCFSFSILPCICAQKPWLASATVTLWLDCSLLAWTYTRDALLLDMKAAVMSCASDPKGAMCLVERQCSVFQLAERNSFYLPCSALHVTRTMCTRRHLRHTHTQHVPDSRHYQTSTVVEGLQRCSGTETKT